MFSASSPQSGASRCVNYPGRAIEVQSCASLITPWVLRKIDSIRDILGFSEQLFDAFFLNLIYRFIDFVQLLPSAPSAPLGSLIAEGLCRAEFCLRHWVEARRRGDVLELYAGFSAVLLFDVDRVLQSFQVNLLDEQGDFMGYWNPLFGTMHDSSASYYVIVPLYRDKTVFRSEISALLVRQLIGKDIYQSLSSDRSFYFDWLALFSDANHTNSVFSQVIELFKNNDLLLKLKQVHVGLDFQISMLDAYSVEDALLFVQWLKAESQAGRISVNRPGDLLQILDRGAFVDPKLLARYVKNVLSGRISFMQLFHQLRRMMGATDLSIAQSTGLTQVSLQSIDSLAKSLRDGSEHSASNSHAGVVKEGIILREVALSLSDSHPSSRLIVQNNISNHSIMRLNIDLNEQLSY